MRMQKTVLISLAVHVLIGWLVTIEVKNPFSSKLQQKSFTVFEYVNIGNKSQAPIISDVPAHVSKSASKSNEEHSTLKSQPEENSISTNKDSGNQSHVDEKKKDNTKNEIAIKDKKKEPSKKKKKSDSKKSIDPSQKKSESKKSGKALVNLRKNKKSGDKVDPKSAKSSFDSLLDDAVAKSNADNAGVNAEIVGNVLTATQVDIIKQTISKCWHFPVTLKNAEDLIVDIRMKLAPDGTVQSAEVLDKARMNNDSDFRIAAENAHRAVLDPNCNPLPLPTDKYDEWKELELRFNPKDMLD